MSHSVQLFTLKKELSEELGRILKYWMTYTPDLVNGGFYGKIDDTNQVNAEAPKGSVLNARILWSFAAGYNVTGNKEYRSVADRAYRYIQRYFIDPEFDGVYWTVDHKGNPLDTKKQVYAIAFAIYALSEYYEAIPVEAAKETAIRLFKLLVTKSYDVDKTGYFEAFSRDWTAIDDQRLSAKDANEKKTANTHLHVLEAYSNLYKIWPDKSLKVQITNLLANFSEQFMDREANHLNLFFNENWQLRSAAVSYGHDIEAAWLVPDAAEMIGTQTEKFKTLAVKMAERALEGVDTDGGMWYENERSGDRLVKEKHWWVQAEAMVGFYTAWQLSNKEIYLTTALNSWKFIREKLLNIAYGEWYWGIGSDGTVMPGQDKAGLWKCPYHNSRACIEMCRKIGTINLN